MRTNDFTKECKNIAEIINNRIAAELPIKVKPSVYEDDPIRFEATDTLYYIKSAGHDYEFWNELKSSSVKREAASIKILQTLIDKHKWNSSVFGLGIEEDGPEDYAVNISFFSDINKLGELYKTQPMKPERLTSYTIAGVLNDLADAYYTHPEERITLGSWTDCLAECAGEYGITREDLKEFGYERALGLYCNRLVYLGEIDDWDWNDNHNIVYLKQKED